MKDAAAQLRRILELIPRIADGEEHSIHEVAQLMGVDESAALDDLETLANRFDAPGGFVAGLQIYLEGERASVCTNHFHRPMRLTPAELNALDLGLSMMLVDGPPDEAHAIERARERIRSIASKRPGGESLESAYAAALEAPGTGEWLPAIRRAVSNHSKVRIAYRRGDADAPATRTIRPYRLLFSSGTWYVIAHCEKSEGIRIFRLDRVDDATVLKEKFSPPDEAAVTRAYDGSRAFASDAPLKLRVRYSPRIARWIEEREKGTREAEGSYVVEHALADVDWAVRHVLQYGPEAEVLDPEIVRTALRDRLEGMLSAMKAPT